MCSDEMLRLTEDPEYGRAASRSDRIDVAEARKHIQELRLAYVGNGLLGRSTLATPAVNLAEGLLAEVERLYAQAETTSTVWGCMDTMVVCQTCGNKRCPKAVDASRECTHSNACGQAES